MISSGFLDTSTPFGIMTLHTKEKIMRIIDYYNIFAIIIYLTIGILFFIKKPVFLSFASKGNLSVKWERILFILLLGLGIFLRFYRLATLPEGFHQDEVSNSYEAFCLANYGIDRNGYTYPVYPITWGSGGGSPVLIYLYAFICKFIEPSVFSYRSIFAGFGCLTLILFYIFLRKLHGNKAALLGMGTLAVMPWHIVLSRWGLDSNTIPFWCMLIMALFLLANHTQKTAHYVITSVFCAIILYCYGSATFVMPFFVLFACGYSLWTGRLNLKQVGYSFLAFMITVFPLAVFYFINVFKLPAIITDIFSVPTFTGSHTSTVFIPFNNSILKSLGANLLHLFQMLTIGCEDELWNYVPGYFTLYHFTFPITFLGIFLGTKEIIKDLKQKKYNGNAIMASMLLAAFLFSLILNQNINRMVFFWLPLIYFFGYGLYNIGNYSRYLLVAAVIILGFGSVSFTKDYFTEYGHMSNYLFMKGYGEAIAYAEEIREDDQIIYSTYENLASPFITALLYSRTSPYDYLETAEYKSEDAEFKVATAFTHYRFGFPEDIEDAKYQEHILIISVMEKERFLNKEYKMEEFGNYMVLY